MKIIHCADLHLDSKMSTNLTKEQAKERRTEILRTFSKMVEYAAEHEVKAIIIAGDLFDTRTISATARNLVRDSILQNPDIDFFYLKGNHDIDSFLSKLDEIPANLRLFDEEWKTYSYGKVTITGIELCSENQPTLYNSLVLEHDKYNIVTLHGQLSDYRNSEQVDNISLNDLRNKNIDYLALGHVHEFNQGTLGARGIYCYSGCLEGRGFDECGEKGFVLIDVDENTLDYKCKFISIASRELYTIDVDVTGAMTTQEAAARIEEALEENPVSARSLVKFVLCGQVDVESEINTDILQSMFSEYFYFEKVYNHTRIFVDYSDYEKDASLKGEFIRMVLKSELSEEQKSEVIRCGIQALSGEEM